MVATRLFQFTPLREGRRARAVTLRQVMEISIHAPPRGATYRIIGIPSGEIFQFTPLREGRLSACQQRCEAVNFNSRPSARGDWTSPW